VLDTGLRGAYLRRSTLVRTPSSPAVTSFGKKVLTYQVFGLTLLDVPATRKQRDGRTTWPDVVLAHSALTRLDEPTRLR
jgi:hypothetical protein